MAHGVVGGSRRQPARRRSGSAARAAVAHESRRLVKPYGSIARDAGEAGFEIRGISERPPVAVERAQAGTVISVLSL